MSKHKVVTVVEGVITSLFVSLEGFEIGMSYDGDKTYQSTDVLDMDDALNIVFHPRGIAFAQWKITVTLDDANEPLFKRSGQLTLDNESILKEAIPVPASDDSDGSASTAASSKSSKKSSKKSPSK
ncbi:MAG: hypothetical protein DMF67_16555 [Acidobacteria bacterium]|nr:MAG: hypothetical protein DMF67_16555 [Acidobacteriota bacterium]